MYRFVEYYFTTVNEEIVLYSYRPNGWKLPTRLHSVPRIGKIAPRGIDLPECILPPLYLSLALRSHHSIRGAILQLDTLSLTIGLLNDCDLWGVASGGQKTYKLLV